MDNSMDISNAISKAQSDRRMSIANSFSNQHEVREVEEVIIKAEEVDEDEVVKAIISEVDEVEENPFEKAAEDMTENDIVKANDDETESNVEKADVYSALNQGDNITFKKTGKEIKESIETKVLPGLNAKLAVKQSEADTVLAECGAAPLQKPDFWYACELGVEVPYKTYNREETYFNEGKSSEGSIVESLSTEQAETKKLLAKNYPENKEQGECRRKYNDKIREICEIMVDIKACEILNAVSDEASIDLTARQVVAFQL